MSSSSSKVVVEYAKSNRSSCKICSKTITANAVRLGLVTRDARGFDMTKWHHVHCFPAGSKSISSAEMIGGFSSLKVWKLGFWIFFGEFGCKESGGNEN